MNTLAKLAMAAIFIGTASIATASASPAQQRTDKGQVQTRQVALPQHPGYSERSWMERARKSFDGGGY